MVLGDQTWIDKENYWLHTYEQLSQPWHYEKSFRFTTSSFGPVAHPTFYRGPDDVISDFRHGQKIKSLIERLAMEHGLATEPKARKWYEKKNNVKVEELGLAVPKWDHRIGASTDGAVVGTNGIIEIKSPINFYNPLRKYMKSLSEGWKPPQYYHEHIKDAHYDQMQGAMAILGKDWCDYIVYCPNDNINFVDRVYFNRDYWEKDLYPAVKSFVNANRDIFCK